MYSAESSGTNLTKRWKHPSFQKLIPEVKAQIYAQYYSFTVWSFYVVSFFPSCQDLTLLTE
jgi:hypothetical protein